MSEPSCDQCGIDDPMATELGWLELQYSRAPDWKHRFCGGVCLHQWSHAALERLTRAILGEEPTEAEP